MAAFLLSRAQPSASMFRDDAVGRALAALGRCLHAPRFSDPSPVGRPAWEGRGSARVGPPVVERQVFFRERVKAATTRRLLMARQWRGKTRADGRRESSESSSEGSAPFRTPAALPRSDRCPETRARGRLVQLVARISPRRSDRRHCPQVREGSLRAAELEGNAVLRACAQEPEMWQLPGAPICSCDRPWLSASSSGD